MLNRKIRCREEQTQCHEGQGERTVGKEVCYNTYRVFYRPGAKFGSIRKKQKTSSSRLYAYKNNKPLKYWTTECWRSYGLLFQRRKLYLYRRVYAIQLAFYQWKYNYFIVQRRKAQHRRIINYNSWYHSFCSTESMTSERIGDFLDKFSLTIRKNTFMVLMPKCIEEYVKEIKKIWEKWGLYLFFLPPSPPHLNIA